MQLYYFILKTGKQTVPDSEGQELLDEPAARQHAVAVARQLMQNREAGTRNWRIQVCDDYLKPLFEVFFAEIDETLDRFPPHVSASVEYVARAAAKLNDAIGAMQATLRDVRQTLLQADQILSAIPGARV
ncbi:DUF6894 family protein [Rhodoplanes sp. Z2-YC6860]|uniref:DUF6894 family protein n=1 Tax=Rhodoplanes sp. Z2-YC6860 TaxID=674703 RepID=UPI00078C487C|nr:hypothetical protein [Rhodoplanes sp. Z2-YC6860]AMN42289.1 hypothetical protein RHPLAN_38570 [Rhodoplanes sp. Z2-YC6860]